MSTRTNARISGSASSGGGSHGCAHQCGREPVDRRPDRLRPSRSRGEGFALAGVRHADIGSFHPYDDFIIANMMQLEVLGFCGHGRGADFIREVDFLYSGDLPLNTGGGRISAGQCGLAVGGTNLVEAVRQSFGVGGDRQVRSTANALVTGIGGIPYGRNWSTSAVMILTPNA